MEEVSGRRLESEISAVGLLFCMYKYCGFGMVEAGN